MPLFSYKFEVSYSEPIDIIKAKFEDGYQGLKIRKRADNVFWTYLEKPDFVLNNRKRLPRACSAIIELHSEEGKSLISTKISLTSLNTIILSLIYIFCIVKLLVSLFRFDFSQNSICFFVIPFIVSLVFWLHFQNDKAKLEAKIRKLINSKNPNANYM